MLRHALFLIIFSNYVKNVLSLSFGIPWELCEERTVFCWSCKMTNVRSSLSTCSQVTINIFPHWSQWGCLGKSVTTWHIVCSNEVYRDLALKPTLWWYQKGGQASTIHECTKQRAILGWATMWWQQYITDLKFCTMALKSKIKWRRKQW